MGTVRRVTAPLRSAATYTRWVYLLLGGVLFVPFYVAVLVVFSLLVPGTGAGALGGAGIPAGVVAAVAAALLGAATVWLPGVVNAQSQVTRALVGGRFAEEPRTLPTHRLRAAAGLAGHLLVGFVLALVTMVALTEAAVLALLPVSAPGPVQQSPLLPAWSAPQGPWRWFGPAAGLAILAALVYLAAVLGAGTARLAPLFLGPSPADRLAAAQARADRLAERNRLATELHDSVGHALSVVALQAGAATRVLDSDPEFARRALSAIAERARGASAELDHVLGALRDNAPAPAPPHTLHDLPRLVESARAAGARVELEHGDDTADVPAVVSREAYRVCQEGITNALRHGRPDSSGVVAVRVGVHVGEESLVLTVTNPVRSGRVRGRAGGGSGTRGMAERVRLLGGGLRSGAEDGMWRLEARLPWGGDR